MVAICFRKLMLVMMELLILIFLNVQVNDCAPISFFPSPPLVLPRYSFERWTLHQNQLPPKIEYYSQSYIVEGGGEEAMFLRINVRDKGPTR
jgi:hypothetical protein